MGIDLSTLTRNHLPAGEMHAPGIQTEISPLAPSRAGASPGIPEDVIREDGANAITRRWTAGFPARARAGQILSGSNAFGTEISPVNMPEALRGRMIATSI